MTHKTMTLGDKLAPDDSIKPSPNFGTLLLQGLRLALNFSLFLALCGAILWWFLMRPDVSDGLMLFLCLALFTTWVFATRKPRRPKRHFLLANDRAGFMQNLRLDAKTVIFDGSNIYHFGNRCGLDAQPLGEIANQLRAQGYRLVCFFDANIFHTLYEHGAFPKDQRHSVALLDDIFGLHADEIYVVPKGVQADGYVLESLKHLPISFAVTNDKFRDYAKEYPTVMKDNNWRKGVVISENEIKLLHHRLESPIRF